MCDRSMCIRTFLLQSVQRCLRDTQPFGEYERAPQRRTAALEYLMGVIHTLRGMSVNESKPITAEAVQRRLKAVDVDLRCALAFSRALLRGMAAVSSQARHALDAALHEELGVIANDDSECTAAALHIVSEARADLHRDSGFQSLLALDLER